MNQRTEYPPRLAAATDQERKFYPDEHGPRCPKCGGHAPGRTCRRCGRLPRMNRSGETYWREVKR